MAKFIKAKLKKSDGQTNNDKYRIAANITEYHIISKFMLKLTKRAIVLVRRTDRWTDHKSRKTSLLKNVNILLRYLCTLWFMLSNYFIFTATVRQLF